MLTRFVRDESGFIISAELVLVATLTVIGLIVGLSEVQHSVNAELNDVADAIGSLNQSFSFSGFSAFSFFGGKVKSFTRGSLFFDTIDQCDFNQCAIDCDRPIFEGPKFGAGFGRGFGGTCATF